MKKSRHLAAIALGTCVGLAGVGQVASARRGSDDDDRARSSSCSSTQSNGSENSTGDVEQSGLINLGQVNLQGLNLSILDNLLCQGDLLNNLTAGILGSARRDGDGGGDRRGGGSDCSSEQDNDSENETGDVVQDSGLIGIGGVALQGDNIGALNNVLCGGDVANGLLAGVLGSAFGGSGGWGGSSDCESSQENDSENETGDVIQGSGLLSLGGVALQGNNIGALNNLLCGSNILNDATAAVLGMAGRF
jgi:hypothetical protein